MRLLVISYTHSDRNSVGSIRSNAIERLLPNHGIDVFVLTSGNHDDEIRIQKDLISLKSNEHINKNSGAILRILHKVKTRLLRIASCGRAITRWEKIAIKNSKQILDLTKPDFIFCTYPPATALRLGIDFSKIAEIPLVTDFRDSFLINPIEPGLKHWWTCKYKYYINIKNEVLSRSNLITAASSAIASEFKSNNCKSNVRIIYNGFEPGKACSQGNYFDGKLINIIHTGRLSLSERGTSIIGFVNGLKKAMRMSPDLSSRICFHFVGQLSIKEKFLLFPLVRIGLVKLWGSVERNTALSMQASADMLLLITKPMAANAISGKLIEYLRLKKKIIALTSGSEAEQILERTGLGLIVPPDDSTSIADMVIKISQKDFTKNVINTEVIDSFRDTHVMSILAAALYDVNAEAHEERT